MASFASGAVENIRGSRIRQSIFDSRNRLPETLPGRRWHWCKQVLLIVLCSPQVFLELLRQLSRADALLRIDEEEFLHGQVEKIVNQLGTFLVLVELADPVDDLLPYH